MGLEVSKKFNVPKWIFRTSCKKVMALFEALESVNFGLEKTKIIGTESNVINFLRQKYL